MEKKIHLRVRPLKERVAGMMEMPVIWNFNCGSGWVFQEIMNEIIDRIEALEKQADRGANNE
jgi:hypothetical protein